MANKSKTETTVARLTAAKRFNPYPNWTGSRTTVKVGVRKDEFAKHNLTQRNGLELLWEFFTKDEVTFGILNTHCPDFKNIDELFEFCRQTDTDILRLAKAQVQQDFINKCRNVVKGLAPKASVIRQGLFNIAKILENTPPDQLVAEVQKQVAIMLKVDQQKRNKAKVNAMNAQLEAVSDAASEEEESIVDEEKDEEAEDAVKSE